MRGIPAPLRRPTLEQIPGRCTSDGRDAHRPTSALGTLLPSGPTAACRARRTSPTV
jgi:hypothetical protein